MRINEFLTESELQEGPILNKIGSGIGKAVGTAAKGVGAVAGGVAGLGRAIKKGFTAGRDTVGGAGDDEADAADGSASAPAGGGAPQQAPAGNAPAAGGAPQQAAPAANTAAPTAQAPAAGSTPAAPPKSQFGKLSAAANGEPAAPAANPKADTAYAQAQKAIAGLNPTQKGELVAMLQKEVGNKPPASPKKKADPGAGAMGQMAGQLAKGGAAEPNTMANAPVSKTNTAKPGNPNAAPAAGGKKNLGFGFNTDTGEPFSSAEERTAAGEAGEMAAREYPVAAPEVEPTTTSGKRLRKPRALKQPAAPTAAPAAPAAEPTAPKKKGGRKKPAAPSQAEIDADRDRIMGNFTDSVNRYKKVIAENAIRSGEISIFRKR